MKRIKKLLVMAAVCVLVLSLAAIPAAAGGGIELPFIPGTSTHTYGPWKVRTPATCTRDGVEYCVCVDCGKEKTRTVAAKGHSYSQWQTVKEATFTQPGLQQKTCAACGDVVSQTLAQLTGKVEKWNVNLEDILRAELHLNVSDSIQNTALVQIIVGDDVRQYPVIELETDENDLYMVSVELAAAQMTVPVKVCVISGGMQSEEVTYSVRGYADSVLADDSLAQYHELVMKMLHYGAAAQAYFSVTEYPSADEDLPVQNVEEIPLTAAPEIVLTGDVPGMTFYGASLLYRDRVGLRYYFRLDRQPSDYVFTAGNTVYTPAQKQDLYYIEFADITPDLLDQQFSVTVTDGEENALTAIYSPIDYIVRMNEKGSPALKNLMKALYNYHLSAKSL